MVKRFVKNGCVVNSTTERRGPAEKKEEQPQTEKAMPGTFTEEKQMVEVLDLNHDDEPTRTCNCCVQGKAFISKFLLTSNCNIN